MFQRIRSTLIAWTQSSICDSFRGMHYNYYHCILALGVIKWTSTSANLSIEPLPFQRSEKDEWLRTFGSIKVTCSLVTPCLISYSICLQVFVRLPYFLLFLFYQSEAFSDKPLTYFTIVFSICSTCHSLIGKLFCIKNAYYIYTELAYNLTGRYSDGSLYLISRYSLRYRW